MNLRELYDKAIVDAKAAVDAYHLAPSEELETKANEMLAIAEKLGEQIKAADKFRERMVGLDDTPASAEDFKGDSLTGDKSVTLGDHFLKHAGERLRQQASGAHMDISAPEWQKDASDPQKRPENLSDGWGTTYERAIVNARRERLVAADLMGSATVTNATIKYLVEKANRIAEGAVTSVAEGAYKPYIRFADFDIMTETLSKIAALTKLTDEMVEDYGFVAQWINDQLIYELSVEEEKQLLNGDGSGTNLRGLLNRSGIQTHTSAKTASWLDDVFKAIQLVPQATNLNADGIMINPADYQVTRLMKDGNGQYYAGGPFAGQYGVGGLMIEPPLWGLRTVVTNAVPKGTAVVGAFRQGATVLRKGGLRVDSTNTNQDDFAKNLVTFRAEERVGLMVPVPAAFVKLTLTEG